MNCSPKRNGQTRKFFCTECERPYGGEYDVMPPKRNCTSTKPPAPRDACIHLGDKVGTHECETCQGSVKIKLYACALHGTCTLGKKLPEIACCAQCGDYTSSRRDPDPDDGRSA